MSAFKVFYSWQSDLPGNKTRYFIREAIDKAIELARETEAIEAERDEATKGLMGSPDIVQSIFAKINECDLFVADVSLCYKHEIDGTDGDAEKKEKKSPNPNVLIELGYAARALGWDRIICICNTDFGKLDELPFDIGHNRATPYSLENGKSRNENKLELALTIISNIHGLQGKATPVRAGIAHHIIGFYDAETKDVCEELHAVELKTDGYIANNEKLKTEALKLINQINKLSERIAETENLEIAAHTALEGSGLIDTLGALTGIKESLDPEFAEQILQPQLPMENVVISDEECRNDRERIKNLLNLDVNDDFFSFGRLRKSKIRFQGDIFEGSDDEREKYDKYTELSSILLRLEAREDYLHTFDGMRFVPLAVKNVSITADDNITITVEVEDGEAVAPEKDLICEQLDGVQGCICEEGIIEEIFYLPEDGVIRREEAAFDPVDYVPNYMPFIKERGKTEEDYEEALADFIAQASGVNRYEFEISSLRPNECKWLTPGILVKPAPNGKIGIHYRISSSKSTGKIEGRLELIE